MTICEHSLRWILNMRHGLRKVKPLYRYDLKLLDKYIKNDGHSGGSFNWTYRQCQEIDKIGLDKWIKTDNAKGFVYCLNNPIKS